MFLKNALGEEIFTYCLLDPDYHSPEAIAARYEEAKRVGVRVHVWRHKEIENYLLVPSAIRRAIVSKLGKEIDGLTDNEVKSQLDKVANKQKNLAFDAIAQEILGENRSKGAKFANETARERISTAWGSLNGKLAIISGKLLFSKISEWSQNRFGVSFSARRIAREIRTYEMDPEIKEVVSAIEEKREIAK